MALRLRTHTGWCDLNIAWISSSWHSKQDNVPESKYNLFFWKFWDRQYKLQGGWKTLLSCQNSWSIVVFWLFAFLILRLLICILELDTAQTRYQKSGFWSKFSKRRLSLFFGCWWWWYGSKAFNICLNLSTSSELSWGLLDISVVAATTSCYVKWSSLVLSNFLYPFN